MAATQNYSLPLPQLGEPADIRVLDQGTEMIDGIMHGNRTMIAPGWVSTETYNTGRRVVYLGEYYKCKEDNVTGAWDATKWDKTTVGEDIEGLGTGGASALADLDDVEITNPSTGQALLFDDDDDVWKNQDLPDVSVTKEASGNPIEITDAAAAPMVKCVTQITGYQSGTGTPSPDNIRPITAYTEGEIEVGDTKTFNDLERGGYNNDGSKRNATNRVRTPIFLLKAGAHIVKCVSNIGKTPTIAYVTWLNDSYGSNTLISDSGWQGATVTVTLANDTYICFIIKNTDESNFNTTDITLTITEKSTTHTTTYPSAIYRGSEDVVNGEVESEWIKVVFDGSVDEAWEMLGSGSASGYAMKISIPDLPLDRNIAKSLLISNYLESVDTDATWGNYDGFISKSYNTTNIVTGMRAITSVADWRAYLSNNPLEVAYKLATPTTSSVTPTNLPIKSLSGYNHIESSTGEMAVEYISGNYQALVNLIQSSSHVYSTAEQVVGKWTDGKDIYEITIANELALTNSWQQYFDTSGIDTIVDVVIRTKRDTEECSPAFSQYAIAAWLHRNGYIQVSCAESDWKILSMTIRYTKTTATRSLSAPLTSQKAQIEPLTDKTEEVPTEEEKAVETPETEEENDER